MSKFNVRHEALPKVGDLFEFSAATGPTVTVVTHRSGRRDLSVTQPNDQLRVTVTLSETEATALAALLTGTHIELTQTPRY
jgi:K+/H+ antiporter YhaU regulatory subunit KhtT